MLDNRASENAELTSSHYRRYPLVQGGLKIKCKINIKAHPVDTGRKLNVHKTFRRRPRRTFDNLRAQNQESKN